MQTTSYSITNLYSFQYIGAKGVSSQSDGTHTHIYRYTQIAIVSSDQVYVVPTPLKRSPHLTSPHLASPYSSLLCKKASIRQVCYFQPDKKPPSKEKQPRRDEVDGGGKENVN